jgi:threonine dehydrogenase-like Zn-dependent dehydrogenase
MKAVAVIPSRKSVEVVDHPEPKRTRETEALVQILDVGVCGTDREIAHFEYGTPPQGSDYLVIGHESLGRVLEVGSEVEGVAAGDLVVTSVRRPCGKEDCRACAVGRQDFCFTGEFTERGINGLHGFMTERIVDDAGFMHVLPSNMRDIGVLVEPLTIAEKALIQVWDVQERLPWTVPGTKEGHASGQNAVVLGAGPVGLLGAMALVDRGFDTWVYSLEAEDSPKAKWVESIGGEFVCAREYDVQAMAKQVGNIDLVYEATGAVKVSFDVLGVLGINGIYCFTGVPGRKAAIEIEADDIMRDMVLSNQLIFGTVNAGPDAFAAAAKDLAAFHERWPEQLSALITGRHAPEQAIELLTGPRKGIKPVVTFGE